MASGTRAAAAPRAGYVYVLATGYQKGDAPVIKIGMTTRTPDKRVAELSRGGPSRMSLVGFVTSRDARSLERRAHDEFGRFKVSAGGGTEYFSADPQLVLSWLRKETPRMEVEAAKEAAFNELIHCQLQSQTNYGAPCLGIGFLGAIPGGVLASLLHNSVWTLVGACGAFAAACMYYVPKSLGERRLRRLALADIKAELEQRYNLSAGTLTPAARRRAT